MAQFTVKRTALGAGGKPEETEETYESTGPNVQLGNERGLQRWQLQPGESVSFELAAAEPKPVKKTAKKGK